MTGTREYNPVESFPGDCGSRDVVDGDPRCCFQNIAPHNMISRLANAAKIRKIKVVYLADPLVLDRVVGSNPDMAS